MSFFFPRIAYTAPQAFTPTRCYGGGPSTTRNDLAPFLSLLNDTFSELQRPSQSSPQYQQRTPFNPRFDLKENKEGYQLEGELPGFDQKDIEIEFTDERTLRVQAKTESRYEEGSKPEVKESGEGEKTLEQDTSDTESTHSSHQATVEDDFEDLGQESNTTTTTTAQPATPSTEKQAQPSQDVQQQQPEHRSWLSERHYGSFTRSFRFPAPVNQDAVKASLKNGILRVVVPKAEPVKRSIVIQ